MTGIVLDSTTLTEYLAAQTADTRAQAALDALTGTVSVKVYNGSDAVMGTGTMTAPWAVRTAGALTIGEVTSFAATVSGTPDASWYLRFEAGGRWVRGSFGLAGSGAAFTWSLPSWTAGKNGRIGVVIITASVATTTAGKWNPGHYFLVNTDAADELLSTRIRVYDTMAAESCITGVVLRMKQWGKLETTQGNYQAGFDYLDADIAALSARGLKMILMLSPAEFSSQPFTASATLVPDYIRGGTYATTGGYVGNVGGLVAGPTAWYANLRHAPVVDRWIALIQALGARYDTNPHVEAVLCTVESAVPTNATYPRPDGMTDNQFRDATLTQWKRIGRAARLAFPNTLVTVMANYMTDRLDDLLEDAEAGRYGIGGPDLYPNPYVYPGGSLHSLPGATKIYMGVEGGNVPAKDYRGILFYSDQNQSAVYSGKEGAYLPEEIRQQMVDVQRQSHCMWVRMWPPTNQTNFNRSDMTWAQYQTAVQWQTGIIPVLRANPATVTTIPTRAFPA